MSADTMINWMLHTGLDVSVLIVLVLLFRRVFANIFGARAAYSLWILPFIRLVLPEIPIRISRPNWMGLAPDQSYEFLVSTVGIENSLPSSTAMNFNMPIIGIWLAGAAFFLAIHMLRQEQFVKSVQSNSAPMPKNVRDNIINIAKELGVSSVPDVRISTLNTGPLVTGMFKPVIILPRNFAQDYNDQQQVLALTHELAHIKRRDLWAAYAMLVFRCLNWPNPLAYYSAAKFRIDQEAACDAYVLKTMGGGKRVKQNYVATLIHSAKLTQTPTGHTQQVNPLCLTISHPLKERLMTIKTSKNKATLLSRIGVASFLVAACVATAPITIASAKDGDSTVHTKTKMKKVIKLVENNDGVETNKHYEITTEDGVTTAVSIDEHGNRTVVDIESIDGMSKKGGNEHMMMFVGDDHMGDGEKHVKIMMSGNGEHMGDGEHSRVIVKRIRKGSDGTQVEFDNDVFVLGGSSHASTMVRAAQGLLDRAEGMSGDNGISNDAKRKIKKARKALLEAQKALEASE